MKNKKRMISLCCAIIVILSVLTVSAFARNNHSDTEFEFWIYPPNTVRLAARDKTDTTPIYLYITSGSADEARVTALGCSASASDGVNMTCVHGVKKAYVTCAVGTQYSVHSFVYENEYSYASLEFDSVDGTIVYFSGKWSPDSAGTYTYAEP